jgi:hypothetical protein
LTRSRHPHRQKWTRLPSPDDDCVKAFFHN